MVFNQKKEPSPKRAAKGDKVQDPSALGKQTEQGENSLQESKRHEERIHAKKGNLERQGQTAPNTKFTGPITTRRSLFSKKRTLVVVQNVYVTKV